MNRTLIRVLCGIAAALLLMAGAAAIYGLQTELPDGMTVSGTDIGGFSKEQAIRRIEEQARGIGEKKVFMKAGLRGNGEVQRSAALKDMGLRTNAEALAGEIHRLFEGNVWERAWKRWRSRGRELTLHGGLDRKQFSGAMRKLWPELYDTQPVDAVRIITADDRVTYRQEVTAQRLDEFTLLKRVTENIPEDSIAIEVPLYEEPPKITVASLKEQGVERLISSYSTSLASSGKGRVHNVRSAAAVVHDMLLAPGDVFDYAEVIRKTEEKYGFCEAPVIVNGKLVPGVGGGICQVSTTIYNAALRAGLDIVERRNHSLPISYAPLGQDATFASGYINFKFRNSTGKHLLIRTSIENNKLTVKIFGTLDPNVTYEIKSVTLETIQPGVKYVKNASLPKGKVELIQRGKPGYVVETYRYKKVGGKMVEKERISKDTYKPQPALYASNTGEDAEPSPGRGPVIEDGVGAN